MSAASKAGLLKRMYADGADTFVKKVKWVAKHIPTITDPQAYVGWLTREERTSMATRKRNPGPAEHAQEAEQYFLSAQKQFASSDKGDHKHRLSALWSAYRNAILAGSNFIDAGQSSAAANALAAKVRNAIASEYGYVDNSKYATTFAKNPAARSTSEMQQRKVVKKAAMHEAKVAGRAARATKKASGHNYVVCDSHGKAVALTTTLAEARKTVPKGGCIEKI